MHTLCWAELSVGTTRRPLEEWEVMAVARQDLAGTKTRSCSMHRNNERGRMLPCWQFCHFDHNCTKFHHQQMSRDQHCGLSSAPETASLFRMVVKLCLSHSGVGDYIWLVAFNILSSVGDRGFPLSFLTLVSEKGLANIYENFIFWLGVNQNMTNTWLLLANHTHTLTHTLFLLFALPTI